MGQGRIHSGADQLLLQEEACMYNDEDQFHYRLRQAKRSTIGPRAGNHQISYVACWISNWAAVEEFCGFDKLNLESFKRVAEEQTGVAIDLV